MNWQIEAEFLDKLSPTVTIAKIVFKYLFENYEVKTIDNIAETTSGGTPLRGHTDYYNGDIPWIKSGELNDGLIINYEETITELGLKNSSAKIYPKGTLVLALYGATAGKIGILNFDSASNQAVAAIYHNNEIEKNYLFWFFKQKRSEYIEISFGAAQPNISQAVVKKTPIPIPRKLIQKEVADFLNAYEKERSIDLPKSLIELKNEIERIHTILSNRKKLIEETNLQQTYLQQLRQSILQEAVQGKLTQQNPTDEPASKLLERIKGEKQKLIKEGKLKKEKELPPITKDEIPFELPKGWVWCRLGEAVRLLQGSSFNSIDFNSKEGVKCIKITNVGVGEFVDSIEYLPFEFENKYSGFLIYENDILISLTRPFIKDGIKVCLCPKEYNGSLLNQRVGCLKPSKEILSKYVYLFMQSPIVLNEFKYKYGDVSQQPNLKSEDITHLLFPLPPHGEQQRIVAKVQQLMQMVNELEHQVQQSQTQAQQLLQAVLKEAFSSKEKLYEENELVTMAAEE